MSTSRLAGSFLVAALFATFGAISPTRAEQVTELDDDGKLTAKYSTDDEGRLHGSYAEYYPSGRVKMRATYRRGNLNGTYVALYESGKTHVQVTYREGRRQGKYAEKDEKGRPLVLASYDQGELDGTYEAFEDGERISHQKWEQGKLLEIDGIAPYPKDRDTVRRGIEEAFNSKEPLEDDASDPMAAERGESLRHLKIYRLLCDVPWRDLQLDAGLNRYADAAAALCERIGKLDHTPPNPGMPEDEYQFGYKGTSSSNLYVGTPERPMVSSVRAYMDDSDEKNIAAVGHRRWCLYPPLVKTGFGSSGKFSAMWAQDRSRKDVPDYEHVSWPPPGYTPVYYFAGHYAWSVSLHRRKFAKPDKSTVVVRVYPLGEDLVRRQKPLELDYFTVSEKATGIPYCIIFRPKGIEVEEGRRYWVEIAGLEKDRQPYTLRYLVEFFEL